MTQDIVREVEEGGRDGLMEAARELLAAAKAEIPVGDPAVDPNPAQALRESGYIRRIAPNVVEVGFATPYAAFQHENQRLKHPRGGSAKFLENPLKAMIPGLEHIIAGEVRKRMMG